MALSTYSDLQAAVISWLRRPGDTVLAAQVPDFIALCEANLNSLLRLRVMEAEVTLAATPGSRFIALPDRFLEPLACWHGGQALTSRLPDQIPVSDAAGAPSYWAVDGSWLALGRPADSAFSLTLRFLKGFALSDAEPVNWLLVNYPNLYLYGTLKESAPFLKNDQRIATWDALFQQALSRLEDKEARSRSTATLGTELAGVLGGGGFNIYGDGGSGGRQSQPTDNTEDWQREPGREDWGVF